MFLTKIHTATLVHLAICMKFEIPASHHWVSAEESEYPQVKSSCILQLLL